MDVWPAFPFDQVLNFSLILFRVKVSTWVAIGFSCIHCGGSTSGCKRNQAAVGTFVKKHWTWTALEEEVIFSNASFVTAQRIFYRFFHPMRQAYKSFPYNRIFLNLSIINAFSLNIIQRSLENTQDRSVLQKHFCEAMRTKHQLYFHCGFVNAAMKTDSTGRAILSFKEEKSKNLQNNDCIFKMRAR